MQRAATPGPNRSCDFRGVYHSGRGRPRAGWCLFDALNSPSPRIVEAATPNSPAFTYAAFQVAQYEAWRAAGRSSPRATSYVEGNTIRSCTEGSGCVVFSNFSLDSKDRLTSFEINGSPVAERVLAGGQTASAAGAKFNLIGALRYSSVEALGVAIEVRNGNLPLTDYSMRAAVKWAGYPSTYVGPDGRQGDVAQVVGPSGLEPHAIGTYVLVFEGAKPGGTLILSENTQGKGKSWEVRFRL